MVAENTNNASVRSGNPTMSGPSNGASNVSTLKLISSKTHVGPTVKSKSSNTLLSAAANKIRLNNDLKVVVGDPGSEPKDKSTSGSKSLVIANNSGQISVPDAMAFMEAWDELFGDKPGTPDYIEKANKLNAVRSQVYASLGINPQKGIRPELTEEQRVAYSEAVKAYSFDYYEVRLSFKQTGRKAVRSKTYRYLNAPDLASLKSKLIKQIKVVKSNWKITQGSVD
jgi:hypothetical protein